MSERGLNFLDSTSKSQLCLIEQNATQLSRGDLCVPGFFPCVLRSLNRRVFVTGGAKGSAHPTLLLSCISVSPVATGSITR